MGNFHIFTSPHCRQFKLTAIGKPAPYCLVRAGFKRPLLPGTGGFQTRPLLQTVQTWRATSLLLLLLATAPAFAQTPNLEVCAGDGFMITSKADAQSISGGVTYTWQVSVNNGSYTVVPDQTAASLPVPSGLSVAGTYAYVRYAASDACPNGVPTKPYTVVVTKPEAPVLQSPATVCAGTPLTFVAVGGSGSYEFTGAVSGRGNSLQSAADSAGTYSAQARSYIEKGTFTCAGQYSAPVVGTIRGPGTCGEGPICGGCIEGLFEDRGFCTAEKLSGTAESEAWSITKFDSNCKPCVWKSVGGHDCKHCWAAAGANFAIASCHHWCYHCNWQ